LADLGHDDDLVASVPKRTPDDSLADASRIDVCGVKTGDALH
jgi:hypothetical protein